MKWLIPMFAICILFLSGCGSGTDETEKVPVPPASMMVEANYHFCGDDHEDRFVADYHGEEGLVYFLILCKDDTLTHHSWKVEALLGDSVLQGKNPQQRDSAILQQMRAIVIDNAPRRLNDPWPNGSPLNEAVQGLLEQQGAERVFAVRLASGKSQIFAWSPTLKSAIQIL